MHWRRDLCVPGTRDGDYMLISINIFKEKIIVKIVRYYRPVSPRKRCHVIIPLHTRLSRIRESIVHNEYKMYDIEFDPHSRNYVSLYFSFLY